MKLKQFIFALVAMLSFAFSAFAQTVVTDAAGLKNAVSSTGAVVTLGDDITVAEAISIPKGITVTLDLNGKSITGTHSGYVFAVAGTLNINDSNGAGTVTGKSSVLHVQGGGNITLNAGTIYRSSGLVVYTTGRFVVNGGYVKTATTTNVLSASNAGVRVAGSGTIQLNGGKVTSLLVSAGNLNITGSDVEVEGGINVTSAKGVNITAGDINGNVTIADGAKSVVSVSGGNFEDAEAIEEFLPDGSTLLDKGDGTFEVVAGLLQIKETGKYYPTLAAALEAAADGQTVKLLSQEGAAPIAMNGSVYGKNVTITGTATVDWSKGFLFVARGGEGDATVTFDNANLTSASNSASFGIHVSGREKNTNNKYDGTVVIKNSTIVLDYLINKGAMTLDNATLTVKNGFDLNGRPASETESGVDANATMALTNNSKLVVNNHNGMGIGREGKGELTVDATSTFEHTQDFLVCAKGTMDVKGTLVSNGKKLTNNGVAKFTAVALTNATIDGTGKTYLHNDIVFEGANSITTSIEGYPFHLKVNQGATLLISRFTLGYGRDITVTGDIADASTFDPAGKTPSLKFNSTSGVSVGGSSTGNITAKNAYIELGSSSWKNAQGTYAWNFENCYVSATSFTNCNAPAADAAKWDVTFNNSVLAAKNYIKNGKNTTYNFTNNSHATTGSLRIDGTINIDATSSVATTTQQNNFVGGVDEHGGINGTVNVAGTLTIGSNAKTQLEVLGGTVNVAEGATLALGNNTLTLDATSAMQSAGNISGAITAADGANVAISGGTYTQDVDKWCAEGFMTQQNADGSFGIAKAVAKVGDKKYATLEEAFKAATSGCTIEIVSDVTVDYAWDARNTGSRFFVPVTINGNGKTIKFTASVNDNNYQAPFRFEADATVKNLIVDMSEVTDSRFRAISSKGNLTVDGCKFIGKDETLNCRAIIFGEGAGANVGNLAVAITNSEFINWKRGITDNENAQDVKTVTITGNTLTDAGVGVSAKEKVTFTGNTVEGAYVNIKSYTAGNKLAVTATGNTLEANTDAAYNVIDAGGVVNAEGFNIVAKGNNFNGYTNADGIWGEVWGNARESFVIKVLDANGNVMGTTSLNNIGGIINGNVNVSWNLKFNAAANTDEYWTMEWTTAPTISNMPARVALWVDGVEVSGGPVVLNGPDDLNKIVAAVTDADGKILSCHTSVANAVAANAQNIALLRETTEEIILPVGTILNKNGFTAANVKTAVAVIGTQKFASLQAAVNAVQDGETITLVDNVAENVTLTEKVGLYYTIDGNGKTMNGSIAITPLSDTNDNRRITIKNINFVDETSAEVDFITSVATNHYPRLTVDGCTFTGSGDATDVAIRLKTAYGAVIKNCTGTGLHSFLQNTAGLNLTIENVKVTASKSGLALGTVQSVTVKGCNITADGYGIRLDAQYDNDAVLESNTIKAFIPVVVRKASVDSNITVQGTNSLTATNTDGIWFAAGTSEYETNGTMPTAATAKVLLVVNDKNVNIREAYGNYVDPVAKVGNKEYGYIEDAIAAWTNNTTLTLLADVTLSDVIQLSSTEYHILDLGTYTMTAASKKDAIQIVNNGRTSASYALDIKANAENPGGITATGKAVVKTTGKSGVKDRPIIRFYNGVFTGTNVIYHSGSNGTNCPQFQFHGGVFNGTVYANRALIQFYGGTFNGSLQMSVDSSAYALVAGGRFKQLSNLYGSSLNSDKFTIGSAKGVYDREVYVDDEGYYVVATTEPTEGVEADVATKPTSNNYFAYSKVGVEGQMAYTNVETALKNNTSATVTVYADEVDMAGINFKGTIVVPAGEELTITNAPADLKVKTTDGYFLNVNENGTYTSMLAVAKVGDKEFETVQKALQYAIDNSAAEVVVLTDVREKMVTDFDLVIKANLTIKAADKFTADAPAKVEFYNEGTSMDFAVGTADGADRCTLTIAENVHFDLTDRVIWLGYYGNNVDVVVNGYLGGYQIWHGANTTVNGMLDSHGEAFIMRRDAILTANEGSKVKANYFNIYSGHINATGADITAGLVWVNGAHNYGAEGNVSFTLNNTSFVSNGEVKMTVGEGKNIPVSVTNGSAFTAKGEMTLANSVDVTVDATSSITHKNGQAFKLPVATINGLKYTSLQDAVDAVKNGETIVLVDVVEENVTVVQAPDMAFTIDGNEKTMKGTITVNGKSAAYATAGLTIKNVNFNADGIAAEACINLGAKGDSNTRYTSNVTVDGCTFTGTDMAKAGIKNYTGGCKNVTITNSTATGMHSLAQFKTSYGVTLTKNTVTECKNGISVDGSTGVTVTECTVDVAGYGIRANGGSDVTVTSNNVKAFTPVVVRSVTANSSFTFNGENIMVAADETGKWMVIGDEEYEAGKTLPAESTANVVVALNDANLSYTGIHGAGLAGKGTEAEPYLINNATELQMFRDKVNAGATKYSKPGVWVALGADIDLAGINWVGIGSMTADHGFMGNFDGNGHTIKNLTITNPALDSDGYAYAGLFALTEGAEDNQNVVKNLTIENVTIKTDGHIAAAAIAYAYYTIVDNVKVCGDIAIEGGDYTAGVLAYTRRCVNASNLAVEGNDGSYIKGAKTVGGVISDIQTNGGLVVDYKNFSAMNVAVSGAKNVGGISGVISGQAVDGATVKNVTLTLTSDDARVGTVAGAMGLASTISNVAVENVEGATAVIGATFNDAKPIEARIGDKYYATFAAAYAAAQAGETVTMLVDLTIAESLAIDKSIAIDGNGRTLTYTGSGASARAITVENTAQGVELAISNLTVDCTASYCQRGINYNTNGKLTLDNVTVKGTNVTYAVNLPGSADRAEVTILNSNLTGNIALNVWGENSVVNVENTTLTAVDNSTAEGYAAVKLNNDGTTAAEGTVINITGGKIDVTGSACEDTEAVSNATSTGEINISESTVVNGEVTTIVAVIRYNNGYSYSFQTLEAAIAKAEAGETVTLVRDVTASAIVTINKAITLDGNGKTLTSTAGRAINVETEGDVTIKNLTIKASGERAINVIQKPANLTIENVTATAANYTVNLAGSAANAVVAINKSELTGLNIVNVAAPGAQVTVNETVLNCADHNDSEKYAALALNKDAKNGSIVATNVTFNIEGDSRKATNQAENGTVTIDGSTEGVEVHVAYISYGNNWYGFATLEKAIEKAKDGETIVLISDIVLGKTVNVNKSVTIDGNGKTITTAESVATNNHAAFYIDGESTLDVTIKNATFDGVKGSAVRSLEANVTIDNCVFKNGTHTGNQGVVRLNIGNATVTNSKFLNNECTMVLSFNYDAGNADDKLVVDNCQFEGNTASTTAVLYYVKGAKCTIKDSEFIGNTLNCNNNGATIYLGFTENNVVTGNLFQNNTVTDASASTRVAGAIFFGYEANVSGNVFVNNTASNANGDVLGQVCTSTYYECTIDLSKNFWGGEAPVYGKDYTVQHQTGKAEFALNSYYTDAELTNEVTLTYTAQAGKFGYATFVEAMAAAKSGETVKLLADIELAESVTVPAGKEIVLDLNGKTITGTDSNTSGNFYLFDNRGTLTITDLTEEAEGKITLEAVNDRQWNASSVVVANNPGGKLTVDGGTIQHLGGTAMAYGIDNLTNGKGTYAETTINGGTVKSTYRAVRQFLNGVEAQNILTVNGGTIEGANKSIWMQDPSKNANTGALTVGAAAKLTGDVYLYVTAGSTAWPVEVAVAAAALQGESQVVTGNVPAGYDLALVDGVYGVYSGAAKIGTAYYATIAEAVKAVQEVETITILAGTHTEGSIKLPATLKNVTIEGAEGAVLKDMTITAADGNTVNYEGLTFDGITFENSNVVFTGMRSGLVSYKNIAITNCKFLNIVRTGNYAAFHFNSSTAEAINGFTFTNNVIDGVSGSSNSGINVKYCTGEIKVENNIINNVAFRPYLVQVVTNDGIDDNFVSTGNTFSGSAVGRLQVLGNDAEGTDAVNLVVSKNIFKGITNAQQFCYYSFNPETTTADFSKNYYDIENIIEKADRFYFNAAAADASDLIEMGVYPYYAALNEDGTIDESSLVEAPVAVIGTTGYTTLAAAVAAAETGATVTMVDDAEMTTADLATQNDGYAVLVNVNGKKVTIDLNGKNITVEAAATDLASAKGGMLLGVFSADLGGHLTLTDNSDAKNGAVTVNVNDAKVYSVFVSESSQSDKSNSGKLTVNGGNYTTVGKIANAMFFTDANEVITVNGGNFHCDGATTTASNPWMFNTLGNNELHVTVNGGTFNVDVNHQHRPFEVKVPETLAVKANDNGTWTVVEAEAYITEMLGATVNEAGEWGHKVGYATIAEAIAAVNELGNKVSIAKDLELTDAVVVPADKTVVLDLNGKTVTMNDASGANAVLLKNNGNLTIMDGTEAKAGKLSFKTTTPSAANAYASNTISNYGTLTIESGNVENLSVGGGACYALDSYAGSTATINGGKLTAEKTAVRIFNWTNGEEAKATINMNGGEIYSKNGYGINVNSGNAPFVALNIAGGTITTDYADYKLAVYVVNKNSAENLTINVTDGTFNGIFALNGVTAQTMKQDAVAVSGGTFEGVTCYDDPAYGFVSGGTFKSVVDAKAVATGFICKDNGDGTFGVIVDPKHGMVAQIIRNDYYAENQYFATINEAVQAAVNGETVTLIADVETSAAKLATIGEENYAVLVAVKEKDITLNLNGKSVTVTPTAEELENAEGKMLMSVFGMDTNGKLTLTGNGSVKVNANGANVYSLVVAYGEGSAVVIENGNYEADKVMSSGSLIYSHEMITVMGGTFNLGNLATGANGSPWIFNTIGQNYTGVKVVGGTYPTDINHQFWANEVLVPEAYALKNNGDGTWTVVDAVAYTNEKATSRGASWRHVGYASLEDAIAATGKYNCQNNTVTMIKDITLEPITVANGVKVAIDLNGKTISGTDNATASFGLITNKGDLTINGTGTIQLTATEDRGWSAYSSVISNTVGGKLTVNGGTIEHLGGTSMAYAIDNLTNGKGTYAETIINDGEIKSTYRPIRMFLNGVEAQNILTVNGGTIESTGNNKAAIWMQTAGDVAHSGTLYVGADAVIKNNVYLDADNLKNVREYPVEAYIAKDALAEGMTVLADAIPAETAALVEYDTFWQVEQKNLAELTIEDDCEEYINKIEKNVGVLTYERYFDDTEWQTIVLPFDVPVANLMDQFEVAYIYNASYKGKQATIDYVVIEDAEFVLAANYPYMIRAKETGWNNIVVEGAKLMPTEAEILDCSSIFEEFSFIGNYATVVAPSNDGMGYFNLTSGAWSKMDEVNPFRFYMQIKLRNNDAFEYPTEAQPIRMRSVNANGEETTGINGVDAEQAGDFIFDIHGRRVLETEKGGIYIKGGKKFIAQ